MATAMRDHSSRAAIARTMLSARNRLMRSCNARMRAYGRPLRGLATIALTSFRRQEPWRTRCLTPSLAQSCDLRSPAAAQPLWLHVCLHQPQRYQFPSPQSVQGGRRRHALALHPRQFCGKNRPVAPPVSPPGGEGWGEGIVFSCHSRQAAGDKPPRYIRNL